MVQSEDLTNTENKKDDVSSGVVKLKRASKSEEKGI